MRKSRVINLEHISYKKDILNLIILLKRNNFNKIIKKLIISYGGEIINEIPEINVLEIECPVDLIKDRIFKKNVNLINSNNLIKLHCRNSKPLSINCNKTNNYFYEKYQWDIKRITNNGKSYDFEKGNHNTVVGIIDSGVDTTHPDLISNFLGGKNLVPANFNNDFTETGDPNDIDDRLGHGTNVAGVLAANGLSKGIAPNIGFKSYRVFNKNGETNSMICSAAIIEAVKDGVKVLNLSFGSYELKGKCYYINKETNSYFSICDGTKNYLLIKRAIQYATKKGVIVVTSSGNENLNCSKLEELTTYLNQEYAKYGFKYIGKTYQIPGSIKNVITVSATKRNDKLAPYSNYGENFIDISAPGGYINELNDISEMCFVTNINSGYTLTEGTSIAAPKVAAVIALLICKYPKLKYKKIKKIIYKTTDKLDNNKKSKAYYGKGLVNAYKALSYPINT